MVLQIRTLNYKVNPKFFRAVSFPDPEIKDAQALYDFHGRTNRELSFKKGDTIILFEKMSKDWWEGAVRDQEGLVPDKYITVSNRQVACT